MNNSKKTFEKVRDELMSQPLDVDLYHTEANSKTNIHNFKIDPSKTNPDKNFETESDGTNSNTPEWDKMWETYQRCKDKEGDLEGPNDFGRRMERERNQYRRAIEIWASSARESKKLLDQANEDWAEDHTYLQNLAKKLGVSPTKVEGDSYGVPGIQELADMIVEHLTRK